MENHTNKTYYDRWMDKKKLRILFVQHDTNMWGSSFSLLALINQLRIKGHSCLVLLPHVCPTSAELEAKDIEYEVVPTPWRAWAYKETGPVVRRVASGIWGLAINSVRINHAAKITSRFRPDIIHTNSIKTPFGAILARKIGKPHVWHFREFFGNEFGVDRVFSLGRRVSCELICRLSSDIVVVSRALRRQFDCISRRVPTHVVYNGVLSSSEMEKTVLTPFPNSDPLTLSLIGRIDRNKHPIDALEAIRILRDEGRNLKLIVAGTGEDTQSVLEYIADHNLADYVDMRGYVKHIGQIYAQSHALLMCSIGDAFGRVTAEAMAYGRPVIGADTCATSELIDNETNGLLFKPGNPDDLADKIRRIIEEKRLIACLGANAAEKAKREFTIERYAESMERIFLSAAAAT